jgi:hypothetical protein
VATPLRIIIAQKLHLWWGLQPSVSRMMGCVYIRELKIARNLDGRNHLKGLGVREDNIKVQAIDYTFQAQDKSRWRVLENTI